MKIPNPALGWLPIFALAAMLGAGFFFTIDQLPGTTLCFLKTQLKFDCPGCGLTRSFLLIPRGEWRRVWELNPSAFVVYAVFLFWLLRLLSLKFQIQSGFLFHNLINLSLGWLLVVSVSVQWFWKMYLFFSENDLIEYLRYLSKQHLWWVL